MTNNGNGSLLEIQGIIESIKDLVEQNQRDYTDDKFERITSAFDELKELLATEIKHSEEMQEQKRLLSGQEMQRMIDGIKLGLGDTYTTPSQVETILLKSAARKWVERSVYVVFFLMLSISGLAGFFTLRSDVSTHINECAQTTANVQVNKDEIESIQDELDEHVKDDIERDTEIRIKLGIRKHSSSTQVLGTQ